MHCGPPVSSKGWFHHLTNQKKHWCVKDAQNSTCEKQNQAEGPNMVSMQMVLSNCQWVRSTFDPLLLLLHRQSFRAGCLPWRALGAAKRWVGGGIQRENLEILYCEQRRVQREAIEWRNASISFWAFIRDLRLAFRGNRYFYFHFHNSAKWLCCICKRLEQCLFPVGNTGRSKGRKKNPHFFYRQ